jgi:DNA-directed RNA polymerase subunit RPC12/RpoP
LELEGIQSYLKDENTITTNPLYNIALGGIKLQVLEQDYTKAKTYLDQLENTPYTNQKNEIITCPSCKSTNIQAGLASYKNITGIPSLLTALSFMIFPFYNKKVYKCMQCDQEF